VYINQVFIIMKKSIKTLLFAGLLVAFGCKQTDQAPSETTTENTTKEQSTGQSGVKDESSSPNIVQTAVGSKDHTTLVTAVKAADLVDALSNAGPFTVFAPTNAAFDKLPAGTVADLLKPENKEKLKNILGYHTYVGTLKTEDKQEGKEFDMGFCGKVKITKKGDKTFVNGSEIVASIPTSNGIIHVIGDVLLPK